MATSPFTRARPNGCRLGLVPAPLLVLLLALGLMAAPASTGAATGAATGCPTEFGRCRQRDCDTVAPGSLGHWQPPSPASIPLLGGSQTDAGASDCCHKCRTSPNCTFWHHTATDPSLPYSAGECYLLPDTQMPGCIPSFLIDDSTPKTVVGGPCNPEVADDPHFTDGYGVTFDFSGDSLGAVYCLVSDENLHVNVLLDGYQDEKNQSKEAQPREPTLRTWIKEVGLLWRFQGSQHSLHLVARPGKVDYRGDQGNAEAKGEQGYLQSATYNGLPVKLSLSLRQGPEDQKDSEHSGHSEGSEDSEGSEGSEVPLRYEGSLWRGPYGVDKYSVLIPGVAKIFIELRPAHKLLQSEDSAHVHFNVGFPRIVATPHVHGVLGQTFQNGRGHRARAFASRWLKTAEFPRATFQRQEGSGEEGLLDGSPSDYVSTDILAANCRKSQFHQLQALHQ